MLTLDANVFVAALTPANAHFSDSLALLTQIRAEQIEVVCPSLVLPECAGAVIRPTGRLSLARKALAFVQTLPGIRLVSLTDDGAQRAADIAINCRLRGADAVYAAVAQEYSAILVTWDQELLTRGMAAVSTMTPTDWLTADPL